MPHPPPSTLNFQPSTQMNPLSYILRYRYIAVAGLALTGLVAAIAGRAAPGADLPPTSPNLVQPDPNSPAGPNAPQPIGIQALDGTHFVVVTREPRLVQRVNGDGRYVNMVLPVVTYYSVQNGRLAPLEHIHVPEGWRPLAPAP
jgi:hypothetical protein